MYTSRKVMGEIRKTSAPGEPNSTNNRQPLQPIEPLH
jgi:hypothetical protein